MASRMPMRAVSRRISQGRAEGNALFVGELLRSFEEAGGLHRDGDDWRLDDLARDGGARRCCGR